MSCRYKFIMSEVDVACGSFISDPKHHPGGKFQFMDVWWVPFDLRPNIRVKFDWIKKLLACSYCHICIALGRVVGLF